MSASEDSTLRAWNITTGDCWAFAYLGVPCHTIAISENNRVAVGLENGQVRFYELHGRSPHQSRERE